MFRFACHGVISNTERELYLSDYFTVLSTLTPASTLCLFFDLPFFPPTFRRQSRKMRKYPLPLAYY